MTDTPSLPGRRRVLLGYATLFVFYQLPQALQDYVWPNRLLWLAATLLFFVAAAGVARWLGGKGLSSYALSPERRTRNFSAGVALGLVFGTGALVVGYLLHLYRVDAVAPWKALLLAVPLLAFGSLLASLSEDVLTRGLVWWQGGRRLSAAHFTLLSAALFLVNHIYVLKRGPAIWTFLFALGLGLAYALHRTGSLWLPFGVHWGWNLTYHVSNTALETTTLAGPAANTWVSAATATVLLLVLIPVSSRLDIRKPV